MSGEQRARSIDHTARLRASMWLTSQWVLAALPFGMAGLARAADPPALRFSDVTKASGVDFVTTSGKQPSREILEVDGNGVALFDFDRDGDLDLFVANGATTDDTENGPGSRMYLNAGDGTFKDVTADVGLKLKRWGMGVAVGDYDGDGWDDVYVTCFGPNVLLRNVGGKSLEDVSKAAGVDDSRWGTGCAFGDIDGDGDLDLYVVNYLDFDPRNPPSRSSFKGVTVMRGPHGLPKVQSVLYENLGDGRFKDVTADAGCIVKEPGYGLGVAMLDFDGDHRCDIFVANDSTPDFFFHNKGDRKFAEIGLLSGIAANIDGTTQASMGIGIADVDGNGLPDKFTVNFSSDTNTLHLNFPGPFFEDRTSQYGLGLISRPFLGWGTGFYDFDGDADEDLFIANGHVFPEAATQNIDSPYEQTPLLFERHGDRFERITDAASGEMIQRPTRGRGVAFGDIDGDGDIDMIMLILNGPITILRNEAPPRDWLIVSCNAGAKNPRGLGCKVEVTCDGKTQRRWIYGGGSFQSASAQYAHFGLGERSGRKASLRVTWSDGQTDLFDDVQAGSLLTIQCSEKRLQASPFKVVP